MALTIPSSRSGAAFPALSSRSRPSGCRDLLPLLSGRPRRSGSRSRQALRARGMPSPRRSPTDPVIHLDEKHVRRPVAEQGGALAAEIEVAVVAAPAPLLRPDDEERRARAVLP